MRISLRLLFFVVLVCSVGLAQYVGSSRHGAWGEPAIWGLPAAEVLLLDALALLAWWRIHRKQRREQPESIDKH